MGQKGGFASFGRLFPVPFAEARTFAPQFDIDGSKRSMIATMDNLKSLDLTGLKTVFEPTVDESKLANVKLRLAEGRCITTRERKQITARLTRTRNAVSQIKALPKRGESLHCILNGEFALFDFINAVLELSSKPISDLTVATLGFSKGNCEALDQLVTDGKVKRVSILCSHYFAAADSEIYAQMVELCQKHGFPIAAMRTHAKLLLMAVGRRRLVVESSANLRSCHNVEQATMYDNARLYGFHRKWINELLAKGAESK